MKIPLSPPLSATGGGALNWACRRTPVADNRGLSAVPLTRQFRVRYPSSPIDRPVGTATSPVAGASLQSRSWRPRFVPAETQVMILPPYHRLKQRPPVRFHPPAHAVVDGFLIEPRGAVQSARSDSNRCCNSGVFITTKSPANGARRSRDVCIISNAGTPRDRIFLRRQLGAEDEVEKLHRIFQREQRSSCRYGGESLIPAAGRS